MGEGPRAALRAELGERAAEALADLDDDQVERLAAAIAEAKARERRELRDAAENSLSFVPRFARGAVKKVVFG